MTTPTRNDHNIEAAFLAMELDSPRPSSEANVKAAESFLQRRVDASIDAAAQWLDTRASTVTRSEFGDVDPESEDDEEPREPTAQARSTLTAPGPHRKQVLAARLRVILEDQTLFSMYKRLMYLSLGVNGALLCLLITGNWPAATGRAPLLAVINVFLCVLFRNELFFRIIYWLTVRALARAWVPVQIKWWVTSFLQSVGGLHSGTGLAAVVWMVKALYDMSGDKQLATEAMVAAGYAITALLGVSCLGAFPVVRHLFHDLFELSHRAAGWASLVFLWVFVILAARHKQTQSGSSQSMRDTLEGMSEYWLALGLTALVVMPWLSVRRVRVEFEKMPSTHASLIRFPQPVRAGYLGRISRSLLGDWHAFGIISDNRFTHTILAGAVGDFTKKLAQDKPQYLYTRTVKFAGLPSLIHMYQRVLLVATGSGLCPFLSFLLQETYPSVYVIWVGKNLRTSFGDEIMAAVDAYPPEQRLVHDTAIHARPNILALTIATAKLHRAEVVIVTSNPVGTREIVNGCRHAGVAAFGPIWDS